MEGRETARDLLRAVYQRRALPQWGDVIEFALHTGAPDPGRPQSEQEIAYTGYARVRVSRDGGFVVEGNVARPAADVEFPECTAPVGGPIAEAAWFSTGARDVILHAGPLDEILRIGPRMVPVLAADRVRIERR